METLLNQNIKELILLYPPLEAILKTYNIGCTTCAMGSCRLADIIEIHNLSPEDEHSLFTQIAAIVYPSKEVNIPKLPRANPGNSRPTLSPPIRMLVKEHEHILKVIAAIPSLIQNFKDGKKQSIDTIKASIEFVKKYADAFHHAKEEDILFKYFDGNQDILTSMCQEHEVGRNHIRLALKGVENGDIDSVSTNLSAYATLLTDHIRKEDEILYPWMDRQLSDSQIGKLYAQFMAIDSKFGDEPGRFVEFSKSL
jgi:hemerythrin-like domain-containing protein